LEQCAKVRAVGEVAFHAAAMQRGQDWIAAYPKRFLALTAERVYVFWVPNMRRPAQTLISLLLLALGSIGLFLLYRRQPRTVWLLIGVALSYQSTFLVVQNFARYSYPVQWILWIGVGVAVHAWASRFRTPAKLYYSRGSGS